MNNADWESLCAEYHTRLLACKALADFEGEARLPTSFELSFPEVRAVARLREDFDALAKKGA